MAVECKSNSKELWSEVMQLLRKDLIRRPKGIKMKTDEKLLIAINMYKKLSISTKDAKDPHFPLLLTSRVDTLRVLKWQLKYYSEKNNNKEQWAVCTRQHGDYSS